MLPQNSIITITSPSEEEVKEFLREGFVSAVGHTATAEIIKELTGVAVQVSRAPISLKEGDEVLVLQLLKRLEEGKVLTSEEMRQFPIAWRKVKVSLTF
jgi:hypothetical protein